MAIKAFIFDFDGLILDTETPDFEAWQTVFNKYGHGLPISEWQKALGTTRAEFDPIDYLEKLVGRELDKKKIEHDHKVLSLARISKSPALPGVEAIITLAHANGIKLAVASSSGSDWVWLNLSRLGLARFFDTICTKEEVAAVKPDPALYRLALEELDVAPQEAIVFEDSPNGITAAQKAGIFCVAVPNFMSRQLKTSHADMVISSMAEITVEELLALSEYSLER